MRATGKKSEMISRVPVGSMVLKSVISDQDRQSPIPRFWPMVGRSHGKSYQPSTQIMRSSSAWNPHSHPMIQLESWITDVQCTRWDDNCSWCGCVQKYGDIFYPCSKDHTTMTVDAPKFSTNKDSMALYLQSWRLVAWVTTNNFLTVRVVAWVWERERDNPSWFCMETSYACELPKPLGYSSNLENHR